MSRLPPLRALQAFEALGRLGSVTRAAGELGVTPGAISQQIRKAEGFFGLRLVERIGNSVELTIRGRAYFERITDGFRTLREAQEVLTAARRDTAIVISCLPSMAIKWLGPRLLDWQAGRPGANIRLTGEEGEPRLDGDDVDFRISYGSAARSFEQHVELFRDWVVPVGAPALIASRDVRTPADLLALPLLSIEWGAGHRPPPGWRAWADAIGVPFDRSGGELAFSLSSAAIDAAINGRGCVLAQMSMIADDLAAGRLVLPFDHRLPLPEPYVLGWNPRALEKPLAAELRTWLAALARRQAILSAQASSGA